MKIGVKPVLLSILFNPAIPAAIFLFGLTFFFAFTHFFGLPWLPYSTVIYFSSLFVWVVVLVWQRGGMLYDFGRIDALFLLFTIIVLVSFFVHGLASVTVSKNMYYLPFMVVAPYLCGRLMCAPDIGYLSRITIYMGLLMLPLLALDFLISPSTEAGRWPFFGLDHGPLLVGSLLCVALISFCAKAVNCSSKEMTFFIQLAYFVGIGILIFALVWAKARGWLLISLMGVCVIALSATHRNFTMRLGLIVFVLAISAFALVVQPRADARFYAKLLSLPNMASLDTASPVAASPVAASPVAASPKVEHITPILGPVSCRPFVEGINSAEMRWVLYHEAEAIFMEKPLFGIGAARFGERSCTGSGGFPHSTVLQGFAELGLIGGGVLAVLIFESLFKLIRKSMSNQNDTEKFATGLVLAYFSAFLLADQIYGNYFMMVGTCLMLGITARMQVDDKNGCAAYG